MEVLTLQFGHYSNYVGSHFWNFQDEMASLQNPMAQDDVPTLDAGRLYAETQVNGAITWRPRLVLVDKKGALGANGTERSLESGHVSEINGAASNSLWDYDSVSFPIDSIAPHPFQEDLTQEALIGSSMDCSGQEYDEESWPVDDGEFVDPAKQLPSTIRTAAEYDFRNTVRTWTDYSKVQLPAASVHELAGWHHDVTPFATYFDGLSVRGREDEECVINSMRKQAELCDQLDSVHTIFDTHDGFSGLSGLALNWVHEEQPKCGKLLAAVMPSLGSTQQKPVKQCWSIAAGNSSQSASPSVANLDVEACAWVSAAFSFAGLLNAGIHVWAPLFVPLWSIQRPPLIGALRYDSLYESSSLIAAALDTATLPYRLAGDLRPSQFLASMTPSHRPVCGLSQALPLLSPHLAPGACDNNLPGLVGSFFDMTAIRPKSSNPYTSLVLRGSDPRRLVKLSEELPPRAHRFSFVHPTPLPLPVPFPQVFDPTVSTQGLLQKGTIRPSDSEVEQCPTGTLLHAAAQAGRCEALKLMATMVRTRKRSAWATSVQAQYGVDADEFSEVLEVITEHLECAAASDSDEDPESDGS